MPKVKGGSFAKQGLTTKENRGEKQEKLEKQGITGGRPRFCPA
ncbi:MAG: hypothetical protein PHU06_04380 [Gallionella sp.]|nr:hypothetical protein [Gallionella sp.]MDD4957917.1 hypothetical protein [Gallionella sp.]